MFRGTDGAADDGLIDVAEAGVALLEQRVELWIVPGTVANFDDQLVVLKSVEQAVRRREVFRCAVKGKRELQQNGGEFAAAASGAKPARTACSSSAVAPVRE